MLLFSLGSLALIFELQNPGLILPGVVGVIAIVLALFAFGTLDGNAAGIALLIFAIVLFIADIKVPTHGFLTAGAIASLVLGLIIVYPPARPAITVAEMTRHTPRLGIAAGGGLWSAVGLGATSFRRADR